MLCDIRCAGRGLRQQVDICLTIAYTSDTHIRSQGQSGRWARQGGGNHSCNPSSPNIFTDEYMNQILTSTRYAKTSDLLSLRTHRGRNLVINLPYRNIQYTGANKPAISYTTSHLQPCRNEWQWSSTLAGRLKQLKRAQDGPPHDRQN